MTCSNSERVTVTRRPPLKQCVLGAIDQPVLVAEGQAEDFGWLQHWPLRVAEPIGWCGKNPVATVFHIGVQAHPLIARLQHGDFLSAVVLILLAVIVCLPHWNDPDFTARGDGV